MKPAAYFPVRPEPLRMQAGLKPLGSDFGNGARDGHFFQLDDELPRYQRAKLEPAARGSRLPLWQRHRVEPSPAHAEILAWMRSTLARELPERFSATGAREPAADAASEFDAMLRLVQEDAAVIERRADGSDAATMLHVCFPSGWRPETLLGASFREIHGPVPGFADDERFAAGMVKAMVEHGDNVRFVWTLCADDALDHHPDEGAALAWPQAQRGWLRVERQVTVGFSARGASLFLIRTYLYPFAALSDRQRAVLRRAVVSMPEAVRRYKGLAGHERKIEALLEM